MAFFAYRKLILSILLALTISGGGAWFVHKNSQLEIKTEPLVTILSQSKTQEEILDSDGDGLKDWEEQLWNTDPHNPDTDGDGTRDGEEIARGRNPLKAAPNDSLTETLLTKKGALTPSKQPQKELTLTDKIARDLFVTYLQQKKDGTDPDILKDQVVSSLIQELQDPVPLVDVFSEKNIVINSDTSPETIQSYIKDLESITAQEFKNKHITKNELSVLMEAMNKMEKTGNSESFNQFQKYITGYENTVNKMKTLAVPQRYIPYHLSLINIFHNLTKINRDFMNFPLDPITGLAAINQYNLESSRITQTLSAIKDRLKIDGIKLTTSL